MNRLLEDARRHHDGAGDPRRMGYWATVVERLESIAADSDPNVAEAVKAWQFGHHMTDEQAGHW